MPLNVLLGVLKQHSLLKTILTVKNFKNIGHTYLFTMTSKHTQQNLFSLTSSAGASHVRIYPLEANAKESRPRHVLDFSLNLSESFAWYDPGTFCWKTWQRCLISEWTLFSGNFPKQGTMLNGRLYQPNKEALVIKEKEFGSLPTPNTMDYLPPRGLDSMIKQTQTHRKRSEKIRQSEGSSKPRDSRTFQQVTESTDPMFKGLQGRRGKFKFQKNSGERQVIWRSQPHLLNPNWKGYISQPTVCRGNDGLSNRVDRLRALGNSIVPAVATIPLGRILDLEKNEY